MPFELHANLATKVSIIDLPLCRVLLEDESNYPWLILVPRRPQLARIMDLNPDDQLLWLEEVNLSQKILWDLFKPTQLNVACIGNKTPQLHTHIIARSVDDPAWPGTVWDHPVRLPYGDEERDEMVEILRGSYLGKL